MTTGVDILIGEHMKRVSEARIERGHAIALMAMFLMMLTSKPAQAGNYSELASQVREFGGELVVVVSGELATASTTQVEKVAVGLCKKITLEGVAVTSVRFIAPSGSVIRVIDQASLTGC